VAVTTPVPPAPRVRPRATLANRRRIYIASAILAAAIGWLLWQGLGNAALFFRTADEAVAQRSSLGTREFRIEGTVVNGSVHRTGDQVNFSIENNGVTVPVTNKSSTPELFQDGIPVVLDGHFTNPPPAPATFVSDQILVKHTASYRAEHPDRVKDYPATTLPPNALPSNTLPSNTLAPNAPAP
jgi:cytochrome c-type biogenesis protein CcmE